MNAIWSLSSDRGSGSVGGQCSLKPLKAESGLLVDFVNST